MATIKYINISLEVWGSILSFIIILCMVFGENTKEKIERLFIRILCCNIVELLSDAAAWGFKGDTSSFNCVIVVVSNFFVFIFGYILLALFTEYLNCYIGMKTSISKRPVYIVRGLCLFAGILVVISQFNHMYYLIDENNMYQRQKWFWISQVWGIFCMSINASLLIRYRKNLSKKELVVLSSYIVLPVAAMSIQIFVYGIALLYIATTISILIVYIGIPVEQARIMKEQELELAESRIMIMLSQIQPHFLYNTLTAISHLCDIDSQKAKKAIVEFSSYLRGNVDSLSQKKLVSFEQELNHVKTYLSLEKMRFNDELIIKYDIKICVFCLPPLTIQPIVENAVRYGVGKKEDGGTITIATDENERFIFVRISDDGVGFDGSCSKEDGRSHVGIQNVRTRLMIQCKGMLTIESKIGVGTEAVISIPKEEQRKGALL